MDIDPGIICFKHCGYSIYCIDLPKNCPYCKNDLDYSANIIPFRVPFPFVRAEQTPCAILLKPSNGDFLKCYNVNIDFHIGITTSAAVIFEYDSKGLCSSKSNNLWNECLIVYQLKNDSWARHWDTVLKDVTDTIYFSSSKYDENTFNCYSFVLTFVQCLRYEELGKWAVTKEIFCQHLIIPRLAVAFRYISFFRDILTSGFSTEK